MNDENIGRSHAVAVLAACLALSACASVPQPAARAAEVVRLECSPDARSQDALVASMAVLRVQPIYSRVKSFNSAEERVNGARLFVRPAEGIDPNQMAGILQCHSARVLLGRPDPARVPNDPFFLPERWLNIGVTNEPDDFTINVSADTVADNLEVLARATRFGRDHVERIEAGRKADNDDIR